MSTLSDIKQSLIDALDALKTLSVETVITDENNAAAPRKMSTSIDLLQGDITTTLDISFVNGELDELRAFHAEQVLKGQDIITGHVKTLLNVVRDLLDEEDEEAP